MRKVLAALITAGCFAAATALSASTANAQVDAWNGGWHVGGDFYYPTDTSYSSAPIYGYGSAPIYNYASAPIYDYGTAPVYRAAVVGAPGPAANYAYGSVPAYGPAVVGTPVPTPNYASGSVPTYGSAVGAPVQTVEIVRTVYLPARLAARREVVTRRLVGPAMAYSRPPRDYAGSASVAASVYQNVANYDRGASNTQPLYDTAVTPVAQSAAPANAGPLYRYVYQRDRILVIDPSTNSVVQALRR
jgi:hypothetical protein